MPQYLENANWHAKMFLAVLYSSSESATGNKRHVYAKIRFEISLT